MTQVIIDDVIPRTQLIAAAGQTVFNTNWTANATTDILVYARADGVEPDDETQLVSSSDYNVTFIGGSQTVRVTFLVGRTLDDVITIVRNTPAERMNLYVNTNFVPSMLNEDFGILTLVDQQSQMYDTVVNPGYNVSATIDYKDKILPILGAQQVWRMNEDNTGIEAFTIDTTPVPSNSYFLTYGEDPALENEQNLALLGNGLLKQTVSAGFATLAIAIPNVDYLDPGVGLGTMAFQNADNVAITGGFANLTAGQVVNTPMNAVDIVNKAYADSIAAGFTFKAAAVVASTVDLDTTYNNGSSGVGATLTANNNGVLSMDGVNPSIGQRVLVKDQTAPADNGIYFVSDPGSVGTPFILTRTTDFDSAAEIVPGAIVFIQLGNTYAETSFVQTDPVLVVGTDPILFVQFSQEYPLSMGSGGTGASITPVINSVVYSTATNMALIPPTNNGVLVYSAGGVPSSSTTLPAGLTIPGYAASGANSDITSMTGLTGKLRAPTAIASSANLDVLGFIYNASAVNNVSVFNNITLNYPGFSASGSDTDVGMQFATQAQGQFRFLSASNNPMSIFSGTGFQHTTRFNMANTNAVRDVTFQDSNGTVAYLADRGWVLIQAQSPSGVSQVEFTNITGYTNYMFVYSGFTPVTNGASLIAQVSINNGSSYLTSAGDYYLTAITNTAGTLVGGTSLVQTNIVASVGNINTVPNASGHLLIMNMGSAQRHAYECNNVCFNTSVQLCTTQGLGFIPSANALNAVRFLYTSGNIAAGQISLYGMK